MNKTIKTTISLFLGIVSIAVTSILIILLFTEAIEIRNLQVLKWLPLLICWIGFYMAGLINKRTALTLTPFLLIGLLVLIPLDLLYFPLLLLLLLFSLLSILLTRPEVSKKIKIPSLLFLIVTFGFYLFSQPLIIKNKGYGTDGENNLYNATVLWDFTSSTPDSLPDEIFHDKNNHEVSLKEYSGKTLYVTFWATWCGPCLAQKPALEKLKKKFKDDSNVAFIDISLDSDVEIWKNHLARNKQAGIQLISRNNSKTRTHYKFSALPFHMIVDADGKFKECRSAAFIDNHLLNNPSKLKDYLYRSYKVFKTVKTNEKETTIRVR